MRRARERARLKAGKYPAGIFEVVLAGKPLNIYDDGERPYLVVLRKHRVLVFLCFLKTGSAI
jgi:hypothetical protein